MRPALCTYLDKYESRINLYYYSILKSRKYLIINYIMRIII
jgi:hypothetical protein